MQAFNLSVPLNAPQPYALPASTAFNEAPWPSKNDKLHVWVGRDPDAVCISISEALLKHHSRYFDDLLSNPTFTSPYIRLPGENAYLFAIMHSFLVRRLWLDTPEPWKFLSFDNIVGIWCMAERLGCPFVQNGVSDLLVRKVAEIGELPDQFALSDLWTRTTSGSPLRRLMVTLIRECWIPDRTRYNSAIWTAELMNGTESDPSVLMANLVQLENTLEREIRVSGKTWRRVLGCEWHVHEEDVTCEGSEEARLVDLRVERDDRVVKMYRQQGGIYHKDMRTFEKLLAALGFVDDKIGR